MFNMCICLICLPFCINYTRRTVTWPLALGWSLGLILTATSPIWAQTSYNGVSKDMAAETCKREVVRFEEAIGFVRQSQGPEAAAALKEKLLPAAVANELLMKKGYCGIARHLKEKKLDR